MNRNRRWKKGRRPDSDGPRGSPGLEEDTAKPRPDLLVFGYASRVFRDNERATFFDKGRHLIPWMGNEALLIDRYDARGHLHSFQPPDDANRLPDGTLVGNELYGDVRYDELCDEERYRDLRALEEEQQMLVKQRHEVEMEEDYLAAISSPVPSGEEEVGKAAENGSYGAVGFSYSTPANPNAQDVLKEEPKDSKVLQETTKRKAEKASDDLFEETPFVPRSDFDIPAHISLPQFERIHTIIEKTAFFIADKGPQLEIVIRSKQANNESFNFLQPRDALYPYYRFLVEAIKSGTYKPSEKPEKEPIAAEEQIQEEPTESSSDEEDDYQTSLFSRLPTVHPKEVAPLRPPAKSAVAFPQLPSGPSIYGSLIQKVQAGLTKPSTEKVKERSPVSPLTVKSFSIKKPDPKTARVDGMASVSSPRGVYGTDRDGEVDGTDLSRFLPSTVGRSPKTGSRPSPSGPPPEVVTAVEKIANYVIKNGECFEEMIKARHGPDDPKFGFVHGYHPYNGLYMERKAALLDAFRHTLRSSKSVEEPSHDSNTEITQKEDSVVKPPPQENKPEVVPPALPSYATPLEVDPRIAELKRKALQASLKIKQKIEEKEALRISLVQKALEETKKLAKEAVENEDAEVKIVMKANRVVAGSFFELIHDETGKKEVNEGRRRSKSRSRERRSISREQKRKSKKEHKERRRRSSSTETDKEKERSSRREEKKRVKNGTSSRKRRSRLREDSEERERSTKKLKHRRDRSRSRSS